VGVAAEAVDDLFVAQLKAQGVLKGIEIGEVLDGGDRDQRLLNPLRAVSVSLLLQEICLFFGLTRRQI
jgi:hypothetical protein